MTEYLENRYIENQTLEGMELVLTDKENNYLGPALVLRKCSLILRTTEKWLTLSGVDMIDCRIDAKKKLVNCQAWCGARITGCSFIGTYVGNEFGHRVEDNTYGTIRDC